MGGFEEYCKYSLRRNRKNKEVKIPQEKKKVKEGKNMQKVIVPVVFLSLSEARRQNFIQLLLVLEVTAL